MTNGGIPSVGAGTWRLRLYVAGQGMKTIAAVQNITAICDELLPNRYQLEVLDLLEDSALAERDRVLAVPMLVRIAPQPIRRIVGDLSDTNTVCIALNLHPLNPAS